MLSKAVYRFTWCVGCLTIYKSYDVSENQGGVKPDTLLPLLFAMGLCLCAIHELTELISVHISVLSDVLMAEYITKYINGKC